MKSLVVKAFTVQAFLAVLSTAARAPCVPEVCPDVYEPVCDSDGNLYKNSCMFTNYKNCVDPYSTSFTLIKCPDTWAPVCDSERITHANSCYFVNYKRCKNPNATIESKGACLVSCAFLDCPSSYICVSNSAERTAKCEYVNPSPTPKRTCAPQVCSPTLPDDPVCGTNGRTYRNECETYCAVDIAHKGAC